MFLIVLSIIIFIGWVYMLFVRPYLVDHFPQFGKFAAVERALFDRSKTILGARLYSLAGALVALQQLASAAGFDVTPFVNELSSWIPEGYRGLAIAAFLGGTGLAFEWLRKITDKPLNEVKEG